MKKANLRSLYVRVVLAAMAVAAMAAQTATAFADAWPTP